MVLSVTVGEGFEMPAEEKEEEEEEVVGGEEEDARSDLSFRSVDVAWRIGAVLFVWYRGTWIPSISRYFNDRSTVVSSSSSL